MEQKLAYQGQDLGIECLKTNDCACAYCSSCRFAIELVANVLAIACENDSREHYNFLCANIDGLFEAAREKLEKEEGTIH